MNRFLLLAAFFAPRRIAKLAGFCGGRRRVKQERHVVVFVAAAGVVAATTVAFLTFLHLTAFKGAAR